MLKKIPVVAVVGPTASGKTKLGVEIAKHFGGEIVCADSMQIYKGMPIASAAPTASECAQVPHHLNEFLDPSVSFSVADYIAVASKAIADIHSRGKLPVLVGGTGLYIDSLLNNLTFSETKSDPKVTQKLKNEMEQNGIEPLYERLKELDPQAAEKLHLNDTRRILRALELYETTGITITKQNILSRQSPSPYEPIFIGITYEDRSLLYNRINERVDKMVEAGLIEEARMSLSVGKTSSQAIGHKELMPYFSGEITLNEALDSLKQSTRRYAKRQLTWFRKNENINWFYADKTDAVKGAIELIERRIDNAAK